MKDLLAIKDKIVATMLPEVAVSGWSWELAQDAATQAGFQDTMCKAVFPEGLNDVAAHFSDLIDRKMLEQLESVSTDSMRTRDRIKTAILARFDVLESMQANKVIKASMSYWALPMRVLQGQRVLWRSADRIWNWAGDEAKDYNRYTKRGLLASLIVGTTLVWIDDKTDDRSTTEAFLDRRVQNIMEIGRAIGTIKQTAPDFAKRSWTNRK